MIQAGAVNPFTHLVGGGDAFIQGIAAKTFSTSFCPWNPYVQSGKFVFADVLYQSFYPPSLILLSIFPNTFGFNLFLLIHYALAGLFVYLYLGSLRLTNYSAFAGGLIFMLCGFMTAHKSHEYILSAAVWLPLTLHFIHRYAERLRVLDLGYAAVPVALSILAGFPQIALYSTVVAIAYVPFCFARTPSMQGLKTKVAHIVFAEFVVLGIGGLLGSLPLFSVAATLPAFTRERITYGMFTSDNFPPFQLLTFLIPNLFGGVNRQIPDYAPDTTVFVAEVYAYLGILPLTLALAGLSAWRTARRELKFWSAVAVIALLMSFGGATPIYLLLFRVPVYNLFRVPARHLFEVGLALSVIAAIGLDSLLTPKARRRDPGASSIRPNFIASRHRNSGCCHASLPGRRLVVSHSGLRACELSLHVRSCEAGHHPKSVLGQSVFGDAVLILRFDWRNTLSFGSEAAAGHRFDRDSHFDPGRHIFRRAANVRQPIDRAYVRQCEPTRVRDPAFESFRS